MVFSIMSLSSSWFRCPLLREDAKVRASINWFIKFWWTVLSFSSSVIWLNDLLSEGELSTLRTVDGMFHSIEQAGSGEVRGGIDFAISLLSFFETFFLLLIYAKKIVYFKSWSITLIIIFVNSVWVIISVNLSANVSITSEFFILFNESTMSLN